MEITGGFTIIFLFVFVQIKYLKNVRYFCIQFLERIILFSRILYHYYSCGCRWFERFHETYQVKGFCSVMNLEDDRRGIQSHCLWDLWGFSCLEAWRWGQQVSCYILCPPFQMCFEDEVHGVQWSGRQEVCLWGLLFPPRLFWFLFGYSHIYMMGVLSGNQLI